MVLSSLSRALRQVVTGRPLFLFPCGFQSSACRVMLFGPRRRVCPIQFHFRVRRGVPDWSLVCLAPQVFIGDSVGPSDAKDPSQACVDEDLQLVLQPFGESPGLRASGVLVQFLNDLDHLEWNAVVSQYSPCHFSVHRVERFSEVNEADVQRRLPLQGLLYDDP